MKKIFSLRLANALLSRGHRVVGYEINTKNPKLKVFIFEDSEKLQRDITDLNKAR